VSELRWESRGMYDYCVDDTGKVVGRTFYLFSKQAYDADTVVGLVETRIGTYVSREDARRAVERAVAQADEAARVAEGMKQLEHRGLLND
jgi:RNase P protein component